MPRPGASRVLRLVDARGMSEKSRSFVALTVAAKAALRKALMVVSFLSDRRHANTLPEVRAKVVHWTAAFVCTGAHSQSPVAVARAGPAEGRQILVMGHRRLWYGCDVLPGR